MPAMIERAREDDEEDARLVAALRRGDGAALDAAYARHADRLFRFLARLAGRRELAEDLFQETWMKLARHATRLDERTPLLPWLYAVARNEWRSHLRHRATVEDGARALEEDAAAEPPPASASPHDEAVARATKEALESAIAALPPAQREVLLLVAVEALAQDEVARMLDVEHAAVRQRLARARAQLAEHLLRREKER